MRRWLTRIVVLGAIGVALGLWLTRPEIIDEDDVSGLAGNPVAGETVFLAGGCASCHAADGASGDARLILTGGQRFPSAFGTFIAPNISPDPAHGIGDWSLAQFLTAMEHGVSPEGQFYYPAFPYPAYGLAERQDLVDLFAYLQTLEAVDRASEPHEVGFPFSIRRSVGAWNLLFVRDDFVVTGDLSAEETRGRYLAEALAHCGDCHTPRGLLGNLQRGAWLQGAPNPSGEGRIPGIAPGQLSWSAGEITAYLTDGFTPSFDSAGGHMRSVIANMAQLPESDRAAIAAYLGRVAPVSAP